MIKKELHLTGSALDHRSLPPEFEPLRLHILRVFNFLLRLLLLRSATLVLVKMWLRMDQLFHFPQLFQGRAANPSNGKGPLLSYCN